MTLLVDPTSRLQTIDGFGGAGAYAFPQAEPVANLLWGTLGLSIFRSQLYVDTTTTIQGWPMTVTAIDSTGIQTKGDFSVELQAYARGCRKFLLTCWAPPNKIGPWPWLAGGSQNGALNLANYADMATAFTTYMTNAWNAGLPATHISMMNEPDITPSYAQTAWTTAQAVSFLKGTLGPALASWGAANPAWQRATGLASPQIVFGETEDWAALSTWIAAVEADSTALGFTNVYATHQYGSSGAAFAPPTPCSRPIWQTEVFANDGAFDPTMTDALAENALLFNALTTGNASAYLCWFHNDNSDDNNSGLVGTNGANYGNPTLALADWNNPIRAKRAFALGNVAKFVIPGSKRLSLSGAPAGVNAMAFLRPDGRTVIVCTNTNGTSTALSVSVPGMPISNFVPWVTDASNDLAQQSFIAAPAGAFSTTLGASSITTFISDPVILKPPPPSYFYGYR